MASLWRKISRRFGGSPAPARQVDPHQANLGRLLEAQGITLVLDVGANVGQYGRRLRDMGFAGRIVSFEPLAEAHAALQHAAAGDLKWTVAPRTAVGDRAGTLTLHVSNRSDMSSALPMVDDTLTALPKSFVVGSEQAPQVRLADVFSDYASPDDAVLLKVDTQGFEARVLDGAAAVMDRIVGVQLEMSIRPLYEGEATYLDLIDRLAALGFEPFLVLPGFFSKRLGRQLQFDAVFFRP